MRLTASPIAASALGVLVLAAAPSPAGDLRGYSADAAKVEREWETKFRAIPSPDSLREYMRHLAARPHHVGSPYDKANAEWILAKFKSFGLDAQIETFDVLFPTPKERVVDMPVYPGDPLTPGVGATKDAKRLATAEAQTITKIPVLPISYGDAQPLLAALAGPTAPDEWRGGLGITYHVGPGPAKVHLRVKSDWSLKTLYDVIARIPGAAAPDEWVIRGNHLDAWVNGAEDPISGQAPLLEEARAYGELLKQGWKPRRTIVYAAWDGEEPALLGSTEWVEAHADELAHKAVAYLNSDTNGRGYLGVASSHTLEEFINDVSRDIEDPETRLTVWKRNQLNDVANARSLEVREEARRRANLRIGALGSGSDYTPFLQHAGIASLNLGYGGEDGGGIYHSIYDDFKWFTAFDDTSFVYGRALAQTMGTAVMRLADAELLPYDFTGLAETVGRYAREVQKLLKDKQDSVREQNRQIDEGVFTATNDPREPLVPPKREEIPPYLNFAPLDNAVDALTRAAERYQKALTKAEANGGAALSKTDLKALNATLLQSERALTLADGLPRRPWYRHQIYAPGFYTGYGVKTLPGVREAIEQKNWREADDQIPRLSRTLGAEADLVNRAAEQLEKLTP